MIIMWTYDLATAVILLCFFFFSFFLAFFFLQLIFNGRWATKTKVNVTINYFFVTVFPSFHRARVCVMIDIYSYKWSVIKMASSFDSFPFICVTRTIEEFNQSTLFNRELNHVIKTIDKQTEPLDFLGDVWKSVMTFKSQSFPKILRKLRIYLGCHQLPI